MAGLFVFVYFWVERQGLFITLVITSILHDKICSYQIHFSNNESKLRAQYITLLILCRKITIYDTYDQFNCACIIFYFFHKVPFVNDTAKKYVVVYVRGAHHLAATSKFAGWSIWSKNYWISKIKLFYIMIYWGCLLIWILASQDFIFGRQNAFLKIL